MEKDITVVRVCLHSDRHIEKDAAIYLQKCKRSQATFVSCAIKEFVEKYQLQDLNDEETKQFLKSYVNFVCGVTEPDNASRLQKSLQLIGSDGKRENAGDEKNGGWSSPSTIDNPNTLSTPSVDEKECASPSPPAFREEKNISEASREKMNSVLGKFRQQK